ncbi:OmpA family protein [Oceanivirga miroungae]|uniref:OmpA family protein n=1 Tax=Oceanivirga miroungae TaxID=1130046 RepID=UPI0038B28BBE
MDRFTNDSNRPTKAQVIKLKAIVKEINEKYPEKSIDISGFTDISSSERYNLQLGLERANIVSELLIELGLKNPQNIRKVSSFGYNNKVNGTLSNNRRVEILVK